jgi:hypothetical protein
VPSAAGEARRALLDERGDALGVVGAVPEFTLVVALDIKLLRERAA